MIRLAKELPYFRWYPADAESDSKYASLDLAELGLYHRCLNHAWLNNGIPDDLTELSRELRIPEKEVRRLWPRVSRCFVVSPDMRARNPRQEEERRMAVSKSDKASSSATAGQKNEPGFIYLATRASDGAVKIGSTNNVARRIAQLKYRYRAESITLTDSFRVEDMCRSESEIHASVADKRVAGEWYAITDEDKTAITLWGDKEGDSQYHPSPRAYESESVSESKDLPVPKTTKTENTTLPRWVLDEHYQIFAKVAREFWRDLIDEDLSGWYWEWTNLDSEQKQLAITRVRQRIESGQPFQKVFKFTYFSRGEWKREVLVSAVPPQPKGEAYKTYVDPYKHLIGVKNGTE